MHGKDPWRAALLGAVAGLAASFVMNSFQKPWKTLEKAASEEPCNPKEDEPTTIKAADKIAEAVTDRRVPDPLRPYAGPLMHYGLGAALGAAYGAAAEYSPKVTWGYGAGYGAAISLLLDETILPLWGIAPPPRGASLSAHFRGFVSHLVFGLSLEGARRILRRVG